MNIKNKLKYEGTVHTSRRCGDFKVIEYQDAYNVIVEFAKTGTTKRASLSSIRVGAVLDPYFPTIFGVGCMGEGKYKSRNNNEKKTKEYSTWENMVARCYYPKTSRYSAYGGAGVTVCKEWLNFQNFAKWFEQNYREGFHLDKDVIAPGSKEYSPASCVFIPQEINNLLVNNRKNHGKSSCLPVGVSKGKRNTFQTGVSIKGKVLTRKNFHSLQEAVDYYHNEKARYVREISKEYYLQGKLPERAYTALAEYKVSNYTKNSS